MSGKRAKEVLLTPQEAQTKKLPKGYAWVPVLDQSGIAVTSAGAPAAAPETAPTPTHDTVESSLGKRPRKKKDYSEYISPTSRKHVTKNGTKRQKTSHPTYDDMTEPETETTPVVMTPPQEEKPESAKLRKKMLQQQIQELMALEDKVAKTLEQKKPTGDQAATPPTMTSPPSIALDSVPGSDSSLPAPLTGETQHALPSPPSLSAASSPPPPLPSVSIITEPLLGTENGATHAHATENHQPKKKRSGKSTKRRTASPPSRTPRDSPPAVATPTFISTPGVRSQRARRARRTYYDGPAELSESLQQCQQILKLLMSHRYAWPFNQPVDPIALNIPDYFDIIKEPMDFGTIAEQLESGGYDSPEEFYDHVQLVFSNAFTYNPPGSDICVMAQTLKDLFEKKWASVRHRDERRASEMGSYVGQTLKEVMNTVAALQREVESMKGKAAAAGSAAFAGSKLGGYKGRPGPASNKKMTFEQKKALSDAINSLDSDELGMVVKIIHERMPRLAQSSDPEEIEIDIDALDNNTLRELEKYVRSCLAKKRKKNPAAAAAADRLEAAARSAQGTAKKIEGIQKRLEEINKHISLAGSGLLATHPTATTAAAGTIPTKATKADTEDYVDIGDEAHPKKYPPVVIDAAANTSESDSSESEDSDSESESSSSESSDSESEEESPQAPLAGSQQAAAPPTTTTTATTTTITSPTAPTPAAPPLATPPPVPTSVSPVVPMETEPTPATTPTKPVVLQNLDSWKTLEDTTGPAKEETPASSVTSDSGDPLWSEFRQKEQLEKRREMDRAEQEERLRRERQEREEERRRAEEQRRKELEELQAKRLREEREAELEAQRRLEAERERAKEERRKLAAQRALDMTEQSVVMASFEAQVGKPLGVLRLKETDEREPTG